MNDSQVGFWEPAKWVAKLRALKTDANPLFGEKDGSVKLVKVYGMRTRMLAIELTNGSSFRLPVKLIPWLRDIPAKQLAGVEVSPSGEGLHWESVDIDLSVPGLLEQIFGTTSWMRQLGSRGGRSRSPAKVRAARSNGAKGGRPRGSGKGRRRSRVAA